MLKEIHFGVSQPFITFASIVALDAANRRVSLAFLEEEF